MTNAFMNAIAETMREDGKSEGSIELYLIKGRKLNGNKEFRSLVFLKNIDAIQKQLDEIENSSTRKSYLTAISALIKASNNKLTNKLKAHYNALMRKAAIDYRENTNDEKTEKQKENWLSWEQIEAKHDRLTSITNGMMEKLTNKEIFKWSKGRQQFADHMLLSLYVMIPPRRSEDYFSMYIDEPDDNKNKNYYDKENQVFVFNKYKTSKMHGQDTIKVPDELAKIINRYEELCDIKPGEKLLRTGAGTPPSSVNWITKTLNKMFGGRKLSVSMLRHIYLTDKYGSQLEDMKEDAADMGHTGATQLEYIKKD